MFVVLVIGSRKRRLHIISSTRAYLRPGDRGGVHFEWCLHWILAWGEKSYLDLSLYMAKKLKNLYHVHEFCRMSNC